MVNISVVIPVYNVENFIVRCLDSVRSQTYSDYEVLLVDDRGDDGSVGLAKEYIEKYQLQNWRIVVHTQNRGLSAARNTGIEFSQGTYIYFLDSDDTITENCLETLMGAMDEGVDFVMSVYDNIPSGKTFPSFGNGSYNQAELISKYCRNELPWNAVNRLVRKSFLVDNALYFVEGLLSEDLLWNYLLLGHVRKAVLVDQVTYHYYVNQGSIMNSCSHNYKYVLDLIDIARRMLEIEEKHPSAGLLRYYHQVHFSLIPKAVLWYNYPLQYKWKILHGIFSNRSRREFLSVPFAHKILMSLPAWLMVCIAFIRFYWSEYYPVFKHKMRIA